MYKVFSFFRGGGGGRYVSLEGSIKKCVKFIQESYHALYKIHFMSVFSPPPPPRMWIEDSDIDLSFSPMNNK